MTPLQTLSLCNVRFLSPGLLLLGSILLSTIAFSVSTSHSKYVPPDGKVLLFVGQDQTSIEGYLKKFKVIPAGFSSYTSILSADGLDQPVDHGGGIQFAKEFVDSYPDTTLHLGVWMVDALEKIYNGDLDPTLEKLGAWIQATNRPVYLRIGYGFDFGERYIPPSDYTRGYRYIVDAFRAKGIRNVAYVWHSFAQEAHRDLLDWYPGDDYVDWVALSYFDQPEKYRRRIVKLARKKGKPLMIAEGSPWRCPTTLGSYTWDNWFSPLFKFIEKNNVKAFSYVNCDWDNMPLFRADKNGDARIESNPYISKKWVEEISKSKYLKSTSDLFDLLK